MDGELIVSSGERVCLSWCGNSKVRCHCAGGVPWLKWALDFDIIIGVHEENSPDVDAGTIATGCGAGFGLGCLQLILTVLILIVSGVKIAAIVPGQPPQIPGAITFVSFLMGAATNVAIGYITARKAPRAKMLHVLIVGGLALLIGVASIVLSPALAPNRNNPWTLINFLLAIPLNMLGGQWGIAAGQNETESSGRGGNEF